MEKEEEKEEEKKKKKDIECKFFKKGTCNKGDSCVYKPTKRKTNASVASAEVTDLVDVPEETGLQEAESGEVSMFHFVKSVKPELTTEEVFEHLNELNNTDSESDQEEQPSKHAPEGNDTESETESSGPGSLISVSNSSSDTVSDSLLV